MADVKSLEETDNSTAILPPINVVLQQFILKLSHQVEEIRVRALKNILFKLEHKLICMSDLVQERELLIRLLEWFNSPSAPLKKEVLELLEKLSKHVSAAQILLSIGTIEFLSQLRQDISPDLYQDVDNVIHQLLRLPQDVDDKHDEWCLYKGQGVQPGNNDAVVDTGTSENGRGQLKSSSCPILSKEGLPHGLASSQSIPQFGKPQGYFAEDLVPIPSQSNMPQGSLSTSRSHDTAQLESTALTFFRWMSLSVSDRHVLTATDSRLQSRSPTLVAQSCEFLSDVLFKDFPAEIFLQRPSVFRTLLDILDTSRNTTDDTLLLSTLNCLTSLCQHVQRRLMATSDPALFCPDNDCWKRTSSKPTAGVPSQEMKVSAEEQEQIQERESGDGGQSSNTPSPLTTETDGASLSAGEEEEEDLVVEALQYDQLSVEEVCIAVLSKAIPATTGVLCDNARVVIACLELLFHVGDLLRMVTPVDLWDEDSQTYKVMTYKVMVSKSIPPMDLFVEYFQTYKVMWIVRHKIIVSPPLDLGKEDSQTDKVTGPSLISSFRSLGDAIALHMRKSGYHGDVAMVTPSLSNHRMAVVNLTAFTVQLIQALVPLEQAPRVMSSDLVTVLSLVSIDGVLARTHRHLHAAVLEYLNVLDRTSYQVYTYLSDICQSIVDTCKLLKFATEKAQGGSISDSLALLDKSLPSLAYHKHMGVVREGVRICSRACSSANADPSVVKTSRKVILNILAHYDSEIRLEGYRSCLGVVTEALKVSHVTYPVSTVCQGMVVLLADDVVTQICRYGLYDPDTKKWQLKEIDTIKATLRETNCIVRLICEAQLLSTVTVCSLEKRQLKMSYNTSGTEESVQLTYLVQLPEAVIIIAANSVALAVFLRKTFRLKKSVYLLINLTLADLLVGVSLALMALHNLGELTRDALYSVASMVNWMSILVSLYSFTAIAAERAYAILAPIKHRMLGAKQYILWISLTWGFAVIGEFHTIMAHFRPQLFHHGYIFLALKITLALLSLVIILGCYTAILVRVRYSTPVNPRRGGNLKLTLTLFIATLLSFLCFLPAATLALHVTWFDRTAGSYYSYLTPVLHLNSFINFVLYSSRMPEFRRELCAIFARCCPRSCALSTQISSLNFESSRQTSVIVMNNLRMSGGTRIAAMRITQTTSYSNTSP
ncbi:predicted protein [Nematostella vectensis]|uniref:G-protein coupled receptors family 1 profile domain-containing protein n=1 Tax=Nematostella vectensis TaxID=45351 RepID=A7SI72_NEMVE|nr:predicted protein [Nematostella vectensis]|eukprot:XP_001628664.1 predicted protein [Nematostella vectensis]